MPEIAAHKGRPKASRAKSGNRKLRGATGSESKSSKPACRQLRSLLKAVNECNRCLFNGPRRTGTS